MRKPNIKDYQLDFDNLSERNETNLVVVHHTGNPTDDDMSAEEIHASHQSQGWSGIGYHFVIRKNGQIEKGRPIWAIGAHAYGRNSDTIGIHVSGNFEEVYPTKYQIESLAYLIGWLCEKYDLDVHKDVVGHRDLMATACPGEGLYEQLETVKGKAIWYQNNYKDGD